MSTLRVGQADVDPKLPSHTEGVMKGGARGSYAAQVGHLPDGRATAERSTGVNAEARNPIDPSMPNLSPG